MEEQNSKNHLLNEDEQEHEEFDKIKTRDISMEMKESFLDYSMSVIVSRALPDVRDGLKPVHRRILYAMANLGMSYDKATRKSALLVGEVMGNYHPHGDSAIYSSMVRMAQNFSYRYPLVHGQGNFGNIDGWPAAHMRYTEAKMAKITNEMLRDINKNTVDFMDNYSQEKQEPTVLPSRIPNLLMNGSMGIAVGMATNIPPHNLGELVDGLIALMEDEHISDLSLMQNYIFGPDFPTGAYILGRSGIKKAYLTGRGSIVQRAKADVETMANGKDVIIVKELPYQVVKAQLVEKIAQLVKEKKIEGITDLRDESSNRTGIRIVIECRKDVSGQVILNQLYRLTPLQANFGANMIALVDGVPKLLTLKEMLQHYLNHQINVIVRRTEYDLDKAKERIHILSGLIIALDNIDEIIAILRSSRDDQEVIERFEQRFNLSVAQSKAILSMQMRRLTGLEREKLQLEYEETKVLIAQLEEILADPEKVKQIIKDDLLEIKEKYGDERRSQILESGYDVEDEDLIEKETIVVTMTQSGYIKQTAADEYVTQHRGGKGVKSMSIYDDDYIDQVLTMNSHDYVLFFTKLGKVYRLKGYQIPQAKRTAKGLPIVNLLDIKEDDEICSLLAIDPKNSPMKYAIFATKQGFIKKTAVEEFENINRNGKIAITMREDDYVVRALGSSGNDEILIAASNGRATRFHESDVKPQGRSARGVKGIDVSDGSYVIDMATNYLGELVLTITENGYGKLSQLADYRLTRRGSKGVITQQQTEKTGNLVGFKVVKGDEDLIVVSDEGILIRIDVATISIIGRSSQGVKIMKTDEAKVARIALLAKEDEESDE